MAEMDDVFQLSEANLLFHFICMVIFNATKKSFHEKFDSPEERGR